MNTTGLEIARRLADGASLDETAAALVARYGIPSPTARADVGAVDRSLRAEGFLGEGVTEPSQRTPALRSLFVHLTSRCNLACRHCYVHSPGDQPSGREDLPTDLALRLLDELADLGGRALTLSGGEALLHTGLRSILTRAAGRGLDIRLLTNGTLLDRAWARFLADLKVSVQVSLDGSRPEIHDAIRGRGSFAKVLQAVELLQEAGLGEKLNLCATVMQTNVGDLSEIILLAERLGVPLVRFLPLRRTGMADAEWTALGSGFGVGDHERFYRQIAERQREGKAVVSVSCGLSGFILKFPREVADDEIWCPVGRKIDIEANGDAYPCVLLMEERSRLGNVHRESLASLTRSEGMLQVCQSLVARRSTIERCASCLWRNLCQAGCMGQALDNAGTIEAVDDFCRYRQKAYAEAFDLILAQESGTGRCKPHR